VAEVRDDVRGYVTEAGAIDKAPFQVQGQNQRAVAVALSDWCGCQPLAG
jgi:hypothetical protein